MKIGFILGRSTCSIFRRLSETLKPNVQNRNLSSTSLDRFIYKFIYLHSSAKVQTRLDFRQITLVQLSERFGFLAYVRKSNKPVLNWFGTSFIFLSCICRISEPNFWIQNRFCSGFRHFVPFVLFLSQTERSVFEQICWKF